MSSQLKEVKENESTNTFYKDVRPKAESSTKVNLNDLLSKISKEKKTNSGGNERSGNRGPLVDGESV